MNKDNSSTIIEQTSLPNNMQGQVSLILNKHDGHNSTTIHFIPVHLISKLTAMQAETVKNFRI